MHKQQIVDFEKEVQELYEGGNIRGPIHLRDGNEDQLIKIFEDVRTEDYVFSTWGNHIHALLKGVPPESVKNRNGDELSGTQIFYISNSCWYSTNSFGYIAVT